MRSREVLLFLGIRLQSVFSGYIPLPEQSCTDCDAGKFSGAEAAECSTCSREVAGASSSTCKGVQLDAVSTGERGR